MDRELFRETERKLYDYFQAEKRISCLNLRIELLNKHIADIRSRIKETDISIPEEPRGTTYEDTVQTSGSVISYAERAAIRIIDDMENEIVYKIEQLVGLEKQIRDIEADNAMIEYNLSFVSEDHKKILELKYGQEKKDWQVGVEMNIERSTITRIKQKLIEDIAQWDRLIDKPCTKLPPNYHVTRI